jgi:hypothetical protein
MTSPFSRVSGWTWAALVSFSWSICSRRVVWANDDEVQTLTLSASATEIRPFDMSILLGAFDREASERTMNA